MFAFAPFVSRSGILVPRNKIPGTWLIRGGNLDPRHTFSRAQVAAVPTIQRADGSWRRDFVADEPRWHLDEWLWLEGQRTQSVRNPRGEGGVAGTPGTAPTNWNMTSSGNGLTRTLAFGTEDGLPYCEAVWTGTTTVTTSIAIYGDALTSAITASVGQVWAQSFFARQLVGSSVPAGSTCNLTWRGVDSGGSLTSDYALVPKTITTASLGSQRITATRTMSGATTAWLTGGLRIDNIPSGTAVNFGVRISLVQLELGSFASAPILPPALAPAAATRNADLLSWSLASLGIAPNGACTIWGEFLIPQTAVSANQTILQIDSGSDANRYILRNDAGQSSCKLYRVTGGVGGGGSPAGTFTAGSPFRIGVSCDGAGRGAVSMNGGAIVAATGGPTSGLSAFRLGGSNVGTAENLFGGGRKLRVLPYAVSDAVLQSLVASL